MARVPFTKVESLGNDFIILETSAARVNWSAKRVGALCDRRLGIGADGVVALGPYRSSGIRFRLFNADGSSAEWSGNGVRGAGAYLAALNPEDSEFHLETPIGCIRVTTRRRKRGGVLAGFSRPLPDVRAVAHRAATKIARMAGRFLIAGPLFVDAGNPHWILVVRSFDLDWENIGRTAQALNRATNGMNVEFVRVISRQLIELRIFERGVGPTPSTGSGALAAVCACRAMDLVDRVVRVNAPGGTQSVSESPSGESYNLTAHARIVMAGVWSDGDLTARRSR